MKPKRNFAKAYLMLGTLTFAISTYAYLVFGDMGYNKPEVIQIDNVQNTQTVTNTPEQTANTTDIDTSNWETYTSEKYGYSFKYPELPKERLICPDTVIYQEPIPMESFYDHEEGRQLSIRDCYTNLFSIIVRPYDTYAKEYENIVKTWPTIELFDSYTTYIKTDYETTTFTKKDNTIYQISHSKDLNTPNIISTFKFE